jgi:hypothetical protein
MPSLAKILDETQHLSPLRRKLRRLGFPGEAQWIQLAIERGCTHYQRPGPAVQDPGKEQISNGELLTALLLSENKYNPDNIRIAGQLLGGETELKKILMLAKQERVETCLRHIAQQGHSVEPENEMWRVLLQSLPIRNPPQGTLPHLDRFTTLTGFGPGKLRIPPRKKWLRPIPASNG